jgi:aspartate racemase
MLIPSLGIIGGMGPQAGIDVCGKIIAETVAQTDQEHLPFILFSFPESISDRTAFLKGQVATNPAHAIASLLLKMEDLGVEAACLACNTAHAPPIFDIIIKLLQNKQSKLELKNIVDETGLYIKKYHPEIKQLGILSTSGTYHSKLYNKLVSYKINPVYLCPSEQEKLHQAIYSKETGIKANAGIPVEGAKKTLYKKANSLIEMGAEAILLACTELPLVFTESCYMGKPLLDPSRILARAMIQAHAPSKIKPHGATIF